MKKNQIRNDVILDNKDLMADDENVVEITTHKTAVVEQVTETRTIYH